MGMKELLSSLPVAVNNLADPAILRESTERKLDTLVEDGHTGPVGLITKGSLASSWWTDRLKRWSDSLDLFVFASVSGLPKEIEPAPQKARYRTIKAAKEAGAYAIAYVRPIIHTINDSPGVLGPIFDRAADAGADAIISSGFRGDEDVVEKTGLEDVDAPDGQHWSKILKLTPQATADWMEAKANKLNIPYFTRTMCAVAYLRGDSHSVNPYHIAPEFVGCASCPLESSCSKMAQFRGPRAGSIELLRHLGFEVEVHTAAERYQRCDVVRRQDCTLCCTNCPVAPEEYGVPYVNIRAHGNRIPTWGEMSLARFLTGGVLATDPNIPPGEDSRIRLHERFKEPDGTAGHGALYGVNSWLVWSEYLPAGKCLKCSYCFLSMFEEILPPELRTTVGTSPSRVLEWV